MSRSFSEGGWNGDGNSGGGCSGEGGNDWQFHTEGDPFTKDGFTCWNSSDGNGNSYIVADTDGDGKPDTIMDNNTNVDPGSGETEKNTGEIGENTGVSEGDVNPGGGGTGGGNSSQKSRKNE